LRPAGYLILTTPNGVALAAVERWLRGRSPVHYGSFREFYPKMEKSRPDCPPGDPLCAVGVGHIKEYSTNEIDSALVCAGFSIANASTFSPYSHNLQFIEKQFGSSSSLWKLPRRGEVHFMVGRKVGCSFAHPCRTSVAPLYDTSKVLSATHILWRDSII